MRPRYILFHINCENPQLNIDRADMISSLRSSCKKNFHCSLKEKTMFLTRFNGIKGIVRCSHTEIDATITVLCRIKEIKHEKVSISTIATSGTIKSLIKKHDKTDDLKT